MTGGLLFGEWRFVGRLMRKKGLLLVFVVLLQAGLLVSLGIILSLTKVTDTMTGRATLRLDGETMQASFRPDGAQPTATLADATDLQLVLAFAGSPDSQSIPVRLERIESDKMTLRSFGGPGELEGLCRGGSRTALPGDPIPARLVYRNRALLSALIQDRKRGGRADGLFEALR